jgi:hypothetical protein
MGAVKRLLMDCRQAARNVLDERPCYGGGPLSRALLTKAVRNGRSTVEGLDWSGVDAKLPGLIQRAIDEELELEGGTTI